MKSLERRILESILTTFILVQLGAGQLYAQSSQWAIKMFSELGTDRMHDFGSVALNADVEQHFKFKNVYNEDVVIASVSSNCGCTKASATKSVVHPNEIGEIVARVDTSGREHTKQRKATIRVMFTKPRTAEVQLQVRTYIRPDVGFDPGLIEFGTVPQGQTVVKKAFLQYEGRPDWALVGVQKNNPGVRAEAREVKREGGSVVYEIQVELKPDAKPGYIQDYLKFQTNELDRATASIFLPLQGLVVEPLSAKPGHLQLGVANPGQKITKNLVVSGSTPFQITDVTSDDPRLSFIKTDLKRSVHVVPVTFTADESVGSISDSIVISIRQNNSSEDQDLTVPATGFIIDADKTAASNLNSTSTQNVQKSPKKNPSPENSSAPIDKPFPENGIVKTSSGWTPVELEHPVSTPSSTERSRSKILASSWQAVDPAKTNGDAAKSTVVKTARLFEDEGARRLVR